MSDSLLVEHRDGVLHLTLNRPDKRNAITADMYLALVKALADAHQDDSVGAVLVTGAGDHFTAGNDLNDFDAAVNPGEGERPPALELIETVLDFDKPLVAGVRGHAVGIGTTLLMHCDVVAAAESASFALPFTRLGLVPEFGASYLLPMLAGRVRASHTLLLGAPFDRDSAREMGLVTLECPDDALERVALDTAKRLADMPPRALRETKRLINAPHRQRLDQAVAAENRAFARGLESEEHRQAVRAFFGG